MTTVGDSPPDRNLIDYRGRLITAVDEELTNEPPWLKAAIRDAVVDDRTIAFVSSAGFSLSDTRDAIAHLSAQLRASKPKNSQELADLVARIEPPSLQFWQWQKSSKLRRFFKAVGDALKKASDPPGKKH